jgi:phosphatidylglycerophosphatase C
LTDAWIDAALRTLRTPPPGYHRAVATDADGTLWSGDIGDEVFLLATQADDLRGHAGPQMLAASRTLLGDAARGEVAHDARALLAAYAAGRVDIVPLCALQAECLGERSDADFRALLRAAAERVAPRVHPDVRVFLREARRLGATLHVVTGSLGALVAEALRLAEIPYDSVSGGTLRRAGDRVLARLAAPIPLHGGKVDALRHVGAWPAALGLGDGHWDATFLRGVATPVLVRPKAALVEAMSARTDVIVAG